MGEVRASLFDLELTLDSGQFFRYSKTPQGYLLLTQRKAILIAQDGDRLLFDGADEAFIRQLFRLEEGYSLQVKRLMQDPVLAPLLPRYRGLRIMRQDLHETILGFICSSQSNIPKIKMNLHLLSMHCGEVIEGHPHLPLPGKDLDHDVVLSAKTGYRAKFIVASNKLLNEDFMGSVKKADYAQSHALLCTLPGVGPKIADCICLFALGHGEAFPVDVHILRAMRVLFPRARLANEAKARSFAQLRWGKDAGLAQQFIFQWARDTLAKDARKSVKRKVVA
jgi:N-glycosylase/DNA lyase